MGCVNGQGNNKELENQLGMMKDELSLRKGELNHYFLAVALGKSIESYKTIRENVQDLKVKASYHQGFYTQLQVLEEDINKAEKETFMHMLQNGLISSTLDIQREPTAEERKVMQNSYIKKKLEHKKLGAKVNELEKKLEVLKTNQKTIDDLRTQVDEKRAILSQMENEKLQELITEVEELKMIECDKTEMFDRADASDEVNELRSKKESLEREIKELKSQLSS